MQVKVDLRNCQGSILIVALWVLIILTVFAVALGQRASLEIKLSEYQRDKLQAFELAKAAIERAIWQKSNDVNTNINTLNGSWASNEAVFKDFSLGEGTFSASYWIDGEGVTEQENRYTLYGMEDEASKININVAKEQILVSLFEECAIEDPSKLAGSILIWRQGKVDPAEENEYQDLDLPYSCKKEIFTSIPELLLVKGMSPQILYGEDQDGDGNISVAEEGIAPYLTLYTDGAVNINTAGKMVLSALIDDVDLVDKIIEYRQGADGKIGTEDDGWFQDSNSQIAASSSYGTIINLDQLQTSEPFEQPQWDKLHLLKVDKIIAVSSNIYTICAQASVKEAKQTIITTVRFDFKSPMSAEPVKYLFWHKN